MFTVATTASSSTSLILIERGMAAPRDPGGGRVLGTIDPEQGGWTLRALREVPSPAASVDVVGVETVGVARVIRALEIVGTSSDGEGEEPPPAFLGLEIDWNVDEEHEYAVIGVLHAHVRAHVIANLLGPIPTELAPFVARLDQERVEFQEASGGTSRRGTAAAFAIPDSDLTVVRGANSGDLWVIRGNDVVFTDDTGDLKMIIEFADQRMAIVVGAAVPYAADLAPRDAPAKP